MTDDLPSLAEEVVIPLWADDWKIFSPMGQVDTIKCVNDNEAAAAACVRNKVTLMAIPQFKLQHTPPLILVSRKPPWHDRSLEYASEGEHPGVCHEFYSNSRGRFMRINDAYRYVVYQLRRAAFIEVPPSFPDPFPDLDLAWFPGVG